jgi:hypothetical protein
LEASISENTKLLELARGSYEFKTASVGLKHQKMELKAEQEREGQRYAAEERTLAIKERMQDKEFEHRERMIKYALELARLKATSTSVPPLSQPPASAFQVGARVGDAIFCPEPGFARTTQAGIYPTPEGSTFGSFSFSSNPSSVGQSSVSEVWGPIHNSILDISSEGTSHI